MPIDTQLDIETPEGITLPLRAVGIGPRFGAWSLDLLFRLGVVFVCGIFFSIIGVLLGGTIIFALYLLVIFAMVFLYPIVFEAIWNGRTPGKRILGLQVVMSDGTPIGWGPSIVRNLLRTADFMPLFYGMGVLCAMLTPGHRRIGDICANTVVVFAPKTNHKRRQRREARRRRHYRVREWEDRLEEKLPKPVPPPCQLEEFEHNAVLALYERWDMLSHARRVELSMFLHEMHQLKGDAAAQRVRAWALYLLGEARAGEEAAWDEEEGYDFQVEEASYA